MSSITDPAADPPAPQAFVNPPATSPVRAVARMVRRRAARLVADARSPFQPVPRRVPFVVVKRMNSRLGDSYGHWWVEIEDAESYGWWPDRCPLRVRDVL